MLCIVEIACLVFGIIILSKGVVSLSSTKEVRGGPAYIIGLLLVLVFPLAFGIGFVVGIQMAANNQAPQAGLDLSLIWIDVAAIAIGVVPSFIIALVCAKPKQKKKSRRVADEDDYDDYDRDRYRDEDDDRRPSRRRDDDDDDDSPRRRDRDDDNDDYDDRRRR